MSYGNRGVFSKTNELKTAFYNLPVSRNGAQPALRWLFHYIINVCAAYLVAYLAWSIDRRCTQPDWDAADEQFSLLFVLWLLSDKRGVEISQNLQQIVELISRIVGLLQSCSSTTAGQVCLHGKLPNICCSKGWFVDKQVDIVKDTLSNFSWT